MIVFKVHAAGRETILAACDANLLGKEFREGDLCLRVAAAFYGTETIDAPSLIAQLRRCSIANLVGEATVRAALDAGFVEADHVLRIGGIPHAQLAKVT